MMQNIIPHTKTAVFILLVGLLLASFVTVMVLIMLGEGDQTKIAQIGLLTGELFLPLPIIVWARRTQTEIKSFFRLNPVSRESLTAALPLAFGLTVIVDELDRIARLILPVPETLNQIEDIMTIDSLLSALFIIGVVIIIAPAIEELIFRGFFQRILEYRLRDATKAVLFSALTFAIIHFNPWWVVQIYIIGLFMGYVAWRTNSVVISFLIHAINNGFSVWLTHYSPQGLAWYEFHGHVSPWVLMIGIILFYSGLRRFIAVTPIAPKTEEVIFIEELEGSSKP